MTYLPALFAFSILVAVITKVVLARSWRMRAKLAVLIVGLTSWPAFSWWMAFNSLGSGWGFGLVAIFLSVIVGFGVIIGSIWHLLARPA